MEFSDINIWSWIIPLVAGLVCGFVGYLWGKGNGRTGADPAEMQSFIDSNARLTADLESCREQLAAAVAATVEVTPFDAAAARAAFGKTVKQNDLTIVDGIGPKIEGLFHNFDIKTWKALSETSVARCQEVLDSGGDRYRAHDPASWPMQAHMAFEGKWKELVKWQHKHGYGKL